VTKLALQAVLWYTRGLELLCSRDALTPLETIANLLRRRATMETLPLFCPDDNAPNLKYCPRCKQTLEISSFHRNRAQRDGLETYCKVCKNSYIKLNRNKDKDRERYLKYYPLHKDEYSARGKKWHEENREEHNAMSLENYARNKTRFHERAKKRLKERPEYCAAQHSKRRALRTKNGGSFTSQEWKALKEQYDYTCLRCKQREPEIELTADHVISLKHGGTSYIENIQPLCRSCNSWKSDRYIDYRVED
jgi:5-methylcytosine-specific restriction endonuclease McrA